MIMNISNTFSVDGGIPPKMDSNARDKVEIRRYKVF